MRLLRGTNSLHLRMCSLRYKENPDRRGALLSAKGGKMRERKIKFEKKKKPNNNNNDNNNDFSSSQH